MRPGGADPNPVAPSRREGTRSQGAAAPASDGPTTPATAARPELAPRPEGAARPGGTRRAARDRGKTEVTAGSLARLRTWLPGIQQVYRDAFDGPPWYADDEEAAAYPARLLADSTRPGFTHALATVGGTQVVGFATAWTTPSTLPTDRCYPQVSAALGPTHTAEWLGGATEVDELAVAHHARGHGVARALLDTVTAGAPDGRSWLLTSARAHEALRFYQRAGWRQVTHPAPEGRSIAVFLSPHHPATTPH